MIEQEHPIPQQISAYQFRLVGDMTLNQFFQVAGGALLSLAIYSSTLPVYFKWPLIVVSFLAGIAFAFFPLQDRPLATWIVLFFKAIYSPTIYIWKQGAEKRLFFVADDTSSVPADQTLSSATNVSDLAQKSTQSALETKETEFLSRVQLQMQTPNIVVPPPMTKAPEIPATPISTSVPDVKQQVQVPKVAPVAVEVTPEEIKQVVEENIKSSNINEGFVPAASQQFTNIKNANFVPEASPPLPPNIANVVVGQILDPNGKIIDGAILEILDPQGRPLRALRSNKLGHFMIVTPLANGMYKLITEKDGYEFEPLQIECKGEIVAPIAIVAKNVLN